MIDLSALPRPAVEALALETLTIASRMRLAVEANAPSRAAGLLAAATVFGSLASKAGLNVDAAFAAAMTVIRDGSLTLPPGAEDLVVMHVRDGTNPPNAATVLAEETL